MKGVFVAFAIASLSACGGGSYGSTAPNTNPPAGNTPPPAGGISVINNQYSPSTKTVAVGATVQWSWNSCTSDGYNGQTCVAHSVTFDDGVTSPTQDQGTFQRMFTAAGTYNYHCLTHGAAMAGTITVQ
ncbi:MAG TPA: plastocyanin/azurin family copper-binding protein [Gemmatimonadaceae bacterium]